MSENEDNAGGASDGKLRLSKLMAQKGLCSRREADDYISRGLVYVNGIKIDQLGTKVDPDSTVTLATEALENQKSLVSIILNKPVGYVSAQPEDDKVPAVRLITDDRQFSKNERRRIEPADFRGLAVAGRLDIDSQGILLFTQDGRVARHVIGEDSDVEKEYLVRVAGELPKERLELLRHGLSLDGKRLKPAQVEWINEDQLRFVLREGRKRQIRRMCEMVELKVLGLKRVRLGRLRLGDLPEGQWRFLRPDEKI